MPHGMPHLADNGGVTRVHPEPNAVAAQHAPAGSGAEGDKDEDTLLRSDEDTLYRSEYLSIADGVSRTSADDEIQSAMLNSPLAKAATEQTELVEEAQAVQEQEEEEDEHYEKDKKHGGPWELKGTELEEATLSLPSTPVHSSRSSSAEAAGKDTSSSATGRSIDVTVLDEKQSAKGSDKLPKIDELEEDGEKEGDDNAGSEGATASTERKDKETEQRKPKTVALSPRRKKAEVENNTKKAEGRSTSAPEEDECVVENGVPSSDKSKEATEVRKAEVRPSSAAADIEYTAEDVDGGLCSRPSEEEAGTGKNGSEERPPAQEEDNEVMVGYGGQDISLQSSKSKEEKKRKKKVKVKPSGASMARGRAVEEAGAEPDDDVFEFEPEKKSGSASSPAKPKSPPPRRKSKRSRPDQLAEQAELSPSRRRKRRLTDQIEQAKSPRKSGSTKKTTPSASPSSPSSSVGEGGVAFSENLCKVHSTAVRGPHAPGNASRQPSSLRSPPQGHDASLFNISDEPPPRRVKYRDQKTLRRPTQLISATLTDMNTNSGFASSSSGYIHYWDALGRCHLDKEDDDSGFQWCKEDTNPDSFILSDFLGYNEGLGRAYFSSFLHRGRKIEVGNFVKRRSRGTVVEYLRVIAAYQATKSFMGYWDEGAVVEKNSKSKKMRGKEQIQKRGHPYLIVAPLKLKSDVESGKGRKGRKGRKKSSAASDTDTDYGFTSCGSDADGGSKMGTTRRKRQKLANGGKGEVQEDVQHELLLHKELISPNHVTMLPQWLGEKGETYEVIDVAVRNEAGEEKLIKASAAGARKRGRGFAGGNFVCRQALTKDPEKGKRRKRGTKSAPVSDLFSPHLSDEQFDLLTVPESELLQPSYVPLTWDTRFEAAQVQFIREERPWYEDKPDFDFFYADESSDDSDGFDEESKAALRDGVTLTAEPIDGMADYDVSGSETETEESDHPSAAEDVKGDDARREKDVAEVSGSETETEESDRSTNAKTVNEGGTNAEQDAEAEDEALSDVVQLPPTRSMPTVDIEDLKKKAESLYKASRTRGEGNLPSKSVLIKGAAYLRKAFDNPDSQEPLPMMFVHNKKEQQEDVLNPHLSSSKDAAVAPSYIVERKDNTAQVSSRIAYIMANFKGGDLSGPRALCYCLKSTYARSMANQLNKLGVKAKTLVSRSDEKRAFDALSSGDLNVICVEGDAVTPSTNLSRLDIIFHVCVPSSLKAYAEETMLAAERPPSLCILFHRYRDSVETRKSLGLPPVQMVSGEQSTSEKLLDDVLHYCSDGSSCRASVLSKAMGDQRLSMQFGGKSCCDNCRCRLNLEGSPLALKDERRSVSLGSGVGDKQEIVVCKLDITQYVLKSLRRAEVEGKDEITRKVLVDGFTDTWGQTDCPTGSGRVSVREWERISPIHCLSNTSLLRTYPLHLLIEQGIVTGFNKNRSMLLLHKQKMAALMRDAEEGRVKILIHNFRLFLSSFQKSLPLDGEDGGGADNLLAASANVAALEQNNDNDDDDDDDDVAIVEEKANLQEAMVNSPPTAEDNAAAAAAERDASKEEIEQESEEPMEDVDDPEHQEELRVIRDGFVFFPRLKLPLRSVAWIRNLPYLVQYELWRLMNTTPSPLTREQLEGDIKAYFQQNQAADVHTACSFIHGLAKTEDSMRVYGDILKEHFVQSTPEEAPLLYSAVLHSGGSDKLTLLAPKKPHSCRIFRKFGSSRFLRIAVPEDYTTTEISRLIDRKHALHIAGRYYRYLWCDIESSPHGLLFFSESGAGIAHDDEMTVDNVLDWCVPRDLNPTLTIVDEHICVGLCLVPSTKSGALPAESVQIVPGCSVEGQGGKPNGGCGRLSREALDFVWSSYCKSNAAEHAHPDDKKSSGWESSDSSDEDDSSCPYSSFEGMIGGMRGVWVLDSDLGKGIKVVCRSSQHLFSLPTSSLQSSTAAGKSCGEYSDGAHNTVEVFQWDTKPSEGILNPSLIQALECRGVSVDFFKKYADEGMKRIERRDMKASDRDALSGPQTPTNKVMQEAEDQREQASYPVRRCKYLRLIPDHTDLLKAGEAFVALSSERDLRHLGRSQHLLAAATPTIYEGDIQKLKIVTRDVLRERGREQPGCIDFFDGLKTGIVVGTKGTDPSHIYGGEYLGKLWVCWDDKLVSQVRDVPAEARKSETPQLQATSKILMSEATCVHRARYVMHVRTQRDRAKSMGKLLIILNDLKGMDNIQSRTVAAEVCMLTKYSFHIHESETFHVDNTKLKYPHWFKLPASSSSAPASPSESSSYDKNNKRPARYKSTKALGALWDYMEYKMSLITIEGAT